MGHEWRMMGGNTEQSTLGHFLWMAGDLEVKALVTSVWVCFELVKLMERGCFHQGLWAQSLGVSVLLPVLCAISKCTLLLVGSPARSCKGELAAWPKEGDASLCRDGRGETRPNLGWQHCEHQVLLGAQRGPWAPWCLAVLFVCCLHWDIVPVMPMLLLTSLSTLDQLCYFSILCISPVTDVCGLARCGWAPVWRWYKSSPWQRGLLAVELGYLTVLCWYGCEGGARTLSIGSVW